VAGNGNHKVTDHGRRRHGEHISIVRRAAARAVSDRQIRRVVAYVVHRHKVAGCEIEIVIFGTAGIRRLNERWLGHEGVTDVITFDLGDGRRNRNGPLAGQVNVCWPVAQREAARRGIEPAWELLLYVVHGLLHLLGHEDHEPAAAQRMHAEEDRLLGELGYPAVYAAAVKSERRSRPEAMHARRQPNNRLAPGMAPGTGRQAASGTQDK
jgi:probable rRNA maturation factor